jgi:hypothetical protein
MSALASAVNSAGRSVERHPLIGTFVDVWRDLVTRLFDTYRPELHYMRGPGPKYRERHCSATARELNTPASRRFLPCSPVPRQRKS